MILAKSNRLSVIANHVRLLFVLILCSVSQLERGGKLVLEQVVTTIATVADTAEEKFLHYYDRFMPNLKYIMQNALSSDYRMLRGKTIECISLIGLAVGKEKVRVVLQNTFLWLLSLLVFSQDS